MSENVIGGFVTMGIGLLMAAVAGAFVAYDRREIIGWRESVATQTDWLGEWDESYKQFTWWPVYTFQVDGRRFTAKGWLGTSGPTKPPVPQESKRVLYDPRDPERSRLRNPFGMVVWCTGGVALGLLFVAIGAALAASGT